MTLLNRSILASFLLLLGSFSLMAQDREHDYDFALLGSEKGAYWLYTSNQNSFYFNIDSDSIFATGSENLFLINGQLFESIVVMAEEGIPDVQPSKEEAEEILLEYMFHELKYLKNHQNLEIPDVQYKFVEIGRYHFIEWWYQISNSENKVMAKTNLSTICFDAILNLGISILEGQDIDKEKEFLKSTGANLKKVLGPVDIDQMAAKVQKK